MVWQAPVGSEQRLALSSAERINLDLWTTPKMVCTGSWLTEPMCPYLPGMVTKYNKQENRCYNSTLWNLHNRLNWQFLFHEISVRTPLVNVSHKKVSLLRLTRQQMKESNQKWIAWNELMKQKMLLFCNIFGPRIYREILSRIECLLYLSLLHSTVLSPCIK